MGRRISEVEIGRGRMDNVEANPKHKFLILLLIIISSCTCTNLLLLLLPAWGLGMRN
jgi:hypothetical protein